MVSSRARIVLPAELVSQRLSRVRRGAVRGWWVRNRAFVAVGTALLAIVLALWGFAESSATPDSGLGGWADRAYHTIGLFGFGGGSITPDDLNTQLQIARILAPLVVGYAALRALFVLFRDQAQLMKVRFRARRHVVIAGLGTRGFLLATSLHAAQVSVVVVERDDSNRSLTGCRERGIPVIIGDARDPEVLAQARCDRALHLVCCCPTDAMNLDVLAACSDLAERPNWLPATAHVLLEASALRVRLQTLNVASLGGAKLRADFAGVSELAAKALVGASIEVWKIGPGPCTIVVHAGTETGRQVAASAARAAIGSASRLRLILIGVDAGDDREALLRLAPWLPDLVKVETLSWDAAVDPAVPDAFPRDADAAFVCHPDEALGLAEGLAIADVLPDGAVIVDVVDDLVPRSLDAIGLRARNVLLVSGAERVLGPALLLDTATEVLARARHDSYVRHEESQGRGSAPNPSLVPWDELPESLKESNRRFADSVGQKVAGVGARLVPVPPVTDDPGTFVLSPALVEELARAEHDRWVRDLEADGWRPTAGPKDPEAKQHPLLVPWDDLDEAERTKDRTSILELPRLLGAAGYTITFCDGARLGSHTDSRGVPAAF